MDRRMTLLEAKWDAVMPTLATKADVAELRTEMHSGFGEVRAELQRGINETQRWILFTVIGLFLGFSGLFFAVSNTLRPAASQQPIVITLPAQPQAR